MARYPANYDELEQIASINDRTRTEILYAYLVRGYTYEEVGEEILGIDNEQPGRLPNCLARCYGISGRKSGRYRNVTRDAIERFVREYRPDRAGPREDGSFDYFLQRYGGSAGQQRAREEEQRRRQAQQRAREEEQRRQRQAQQRAWEEEQRRRQQAQQRAWEEEQRRQRQAQQRAWEEEQRRQAQQRAWEEEQRRQQAARQAAEAKAQQEYARFLEQGKRALSSGSVNEAYQAFQNARAYRNTWELKPLLGEAMARASNAARFARDIIRELTEYESEFKTLTADQYRYLAEAYLAAGDKNNACTYFFKEGDVYYDQGDFARADRLYTEGRNRSGYYQTGRAFRVAYARSESKPREELTEEDDRFCLKWYEICRDKDGGWDNDAVYTNLGYHHNRLKEYDQTVALLRPRAERGCDDKILIGNLADACYHLKLWSESIRWYERYEGCGGKRNSYRLGDAKARMRRYDEAFQDFLLHCGNEKEAYETLFDIIEYINEDHHELARRRLEALRANCGFQDDAYTALDWYNKAVEAGNDSAAAQMLGEVGELKKLVAYQTLGRARESLENGDYDEARRLARQAQALNETDNGALVLAEAMVRDNEGYYAGEIYEQLHDRQFFHAEEYIWLAHACVSKGYLDEAARAYGEAGNRWYRQDTQEGYEKADECYTECVENTNRCTRPFQAAFSRSRARGERITDEDRRYCVRFYRQSAEETEDETDLANLSIHLKKLGEHGQIRELLLPKARAGATDRTLLNNLALACWELNDWAGTERWFQRLGELHGDWRRRPIGYAQLKQNKYEEAERSYLLALEQTVYKQGVLERLAQIAKDTGDARKLAGYRVRLMRLGCAEESEAWLLEAESAGAEEIAAQMLALLPEVRRRREEAERRRREEEALLVLM